MRRPHLGTTVLLAALITGCMATQAAILRLPVKIDDGHPGGLAIVRVPLATLQTRLEGFDAQHAAYFFRGREPIAHAYEDTDDDGQPDILVVKIPSDGKEHWIVIVCPGKSSSAPLPDGGSALGVHADFSLSTN
jgi:hypothetical protein